MTTPIYDAVRAHFKGKFDNEKISARPKWSLEDAKLRAERHRKAGIKAVTTKKKR